MQQIGLWHITDNGPAKLNPGTIDLEKHLETWLEHDPSMLQAGLTIVGRQVHVEAGIIDLLALDPQGRWVVIEVKPNTLYRTVITQGLDYAACIKAMPGDDLLRKVNAYLSAHPRAAGLPSSSYIHDAIAQPGSREVLIYVVGAGRDPGLDRMLAYLSEQYSVPISVVSFQVFQIADGHKLLLRELSEGELAVPIPLPGVSGPTDNEVKLKKLSSMAEKGGMGREFQALLDYARKHNFYPRAYTEAVMYTPPNKRNRMLFTVRARVDSPGKLSVYVSPDPFVDFYGLNRERVQVALGPNGWREMSVQGIANFTSKITALFENTE